MHHLKIEPHKSEIVSLDKEKVLQNTSEEEAAKASPNSLEKIWFQSGNPAIEITEGVIHLYKKQHGKEETNVGTLKPFD